jgi:hypothetical protein
VILAVVYFAEARPHSIRYRRAYKLLVPIRDLYPFFLFTFVLFGEFTYLANVVFPYWIENTLIRFDLWLFGGPPHLFIERHAPAWFIELMAFAYWTYFPLVIYVALRYYRPYAREMHHGIAIPSPKRAEFLDFMNRICLSFYSCYVLFMILPARSPRHALNLNGQIHFEGGFFFEIISRMQDYVSVVGAAFPSAHVAVAWVAVMALRRHDHKLYLVSVPIVAALTVSIFILQYHYVLDAVGGVVVAWLLERFWKMRRAPQSFATSRNLKSMSVSEGSS